MDQTNPNGENVETPTTSPVEITTPDDGSTVNPQSPATPSPEEANWNSLSGHAQDRFREVTRGANEARRELEEERRLRIEAQQLATYPSYKTDTQEPDVASAVKRLSDVGIATKAEVNQAVDQKLGNLVYNMEMDRLKGKYDGSTGLPTFDKDEYEDFVSRNPKYRNYEPEDVYQKMYEPEIDNWKLTNTGKSGVTQRNVTLPPTRTQVKEEPLTPELIEQRLRQPDGREWYEKNLDRINAVMSKTATPSW